MQYSGRPAVRPVVTAAAHIYQIKYLLVFCSAKVRRVKR